MCGDASFQPPELELHENDPDSAYSPRAPVVGCAGETLTVISYGPFWQPPAQSRGESVPDHVERTTVPGGPLDGDDRLVIGTCSW
jgi:hypothetical protein